MKKKTTYMCWRCVSNINLGILKDAVSNKEIKTDRLDFNELIERNECDNESVHYDYVCPICESVIICSNKKLSKEK